MVSTLISVADTSPTQPTPPDTSIKTCWPVNHVNCKSQNKDSSKTMREAKLSGAVQSSRLENPLCPLQQERTTIHPRNTMEMVRSGKHYTENENMKKVDKVAKQMMHGPKYSDI